MRDQLRRAGRAFARFFIEPLDFVVLILGIAVGVAFAVFLAVDGASAIEVGLVLLLVVLMSVHWAITSWALDWWRSRRR